MRKPRNITSDAFRKAVDRGQTGEKANYPDPAAAPLGTDEEAAGTPLPPELLARTMEYERRPGLSNPQQAALHKRYSTTPMVVMAGLLVVLAIIALMLLAR